jgi:hypothetical protein
MKHVKRTLLAGIAMFALYGFITSSAPARFSWSGAWQPVRKSAGDGVTKLDIKIGTFINLPDPALLAKVIFHVNKKFPHSKPFATWAVGDLSKLTPAHKGLSAEEHEAYLSHMDKAGVTVFLEVFPFKGDDVPAMIDQWLGKFSHHTCVAGLGIELEYYGKATDSLTKVWDEKVKSHRPAYRLFLRHYSPSFMPPVYRGKGDLLFIDDASEGTIAELNKGFADWANHFYPTACAFQLGYPADEDGMNGSKESGWWKLKDPIRDWGNGILPLIRHADQELGLIWVTAKSGKSYNATWDLSK